MVVRREDAFLFPLRVSVSELVKSGGKLSARLMLTIGNSEGKEVRHGPAS
jgi:hypothetical protein